MKNKINVLFEMSFDTDGECKTTMSFEMPEHPKISVPESVKPLVLQEVVFISKAALAASEQLFSKKTK